MKANILVLPIVIAFMAGLLCLFLTDRSKRPRSCLSISTLSLIFLICVMIFIKGDLRLLYASSFMGITFDLVSDKLSSWIILAISFFGLLIGVYSIKAMEGFGKLSEYWTYFLWTVGAAVGAAAANDLVLLLVFWGFLALTLYLLVGLGEGSETAAKKTFVIVGGADALMIFGIGIIWYLTGTLQISAIRLNLVEPLPIIAYLCLLTGALAKTGAIPLHGWIPDSAEVAPVSVMAFLPAALDKLLGIYLLVRISVGMFIMAPNSPVSTLLLVIGSFTIIIGVMMALVQHDLKKLLSFHAISQVGYMIIGIGSAIPVGVAGGLFHMVNNAIYKSCLFLCSGAVEKRTGTTDLDKLGGLARLMPVTFFSCLVSSLAIAGIPPLNGFVSKWMIYQGLIGLKDYGSPVWIIWLLCAMFASALTLASFIKVIHAVFLGERSSAEKISEVEPSMWFPMLLLAVICLIFGIFAFSIPLKYIIYPAILGVSYMGDWAPQAATLLIVIGIVAGIIYYAFGRIRIRSDEAFIGNEAQTADMRVSGVEFYRTVTELNVINKIYDFIERKSLDAYEQLSKAVFLFSDILKSFHSGILSIYLAWCFFGLILILVLFVR